MKRALLRFCLACALALVIANERATAQVVVPLQPNNPLIRPPYGPYGNPNRFGYPGAGMYGPYGSPLDPNQQFLQYQFQQLSTQLQAGQGATADSLGGYSITGHPTKFFNYGHYFGPPGGNVRPAQPMVSGMGVVSGVGINRR